MMEENASMHDASENKIRRAKDLKPEELNRLFTHGINEEGVFYNRLNFFLVFESLLFAAAIAGFSGEDAPPAAIIVPLCIVGVVVSIVWWYAQVNKLVLLKTLEDRIKDAFDEFRETIWLANQRRIFTNMECEPDFGSHVPASLCSGVELYALLPSLPNESWRFLWSAVALASSA
jgi:hypothetical protein